MRSKSGPLSLSQRAYNKTYDCLAIAQQDVYIGAVDTTSVKSMKCRHFRLYRGLMLRGGDERHPNWTTLIHIKISTPRGTNKGITRGGKVYEVGMVWSCFI